MKNTTRAFILLAFLFSGISLVAKNDLASLDNRNLSASYSSKQSYATRNKEITDTSKTAMIKIGSDRPNGCQRPNGTGLYDSIANATYVIWNGEGMDPEIRAYHHSSGTWSTQKKVGEVDMYAKWDYHSYPSLVLAPDGHLLVFYCDYSQSYVFRSPNAHSIDGKWRKSVVSTDKNVYPLPVVSNGDVYLFYSRNVEGNTYRTYRMVKSSDSGISWTQPETVINTDHNDPHHFDEVYSFNILNEPKTDKNPERIHLCWRMSGGKNHNAQSRNFYHAYYNTANDHLYDVRGTDLGTVIEYFEMSKNCLVYEAPAADSGSYIQTHPLRGLCSGFTSDGTLVVAFGQYNNPDEKENRIKFGVWSGTKWTFKTVVTGSCGMGDLEKITNTDIFRIVYKSDDLKTITIVKTNNLGDSWTTEYSGQTQWGGTEADGISYLNFIENNNKTEVQVTFGEFSEKTRYDYSKGYPVYVIGTAGLNEDGVFLE